MLPDPKLSNNPLPDQKVAWSLHAHSVNLGVEKNSKIPTVQCEQHITTANRQAPWLDLGAFGQNSVQ